MTTDTETPDATGTATPGSAGDALIGVDPTPGVAKPDPVIVADGVVRRFGGLTAVDVEHLEIQRGVITALIGPNGAGKTTFFNLLTGFDSADEGSRTFDERLLDSRFGLPDIPRVARAVAGALGALLIWGSAGWILARADDSAFWLYVAIAVGVGAFAVATSRPKGDEATAVVATGTVVGVAFGWLYALVFGVGAGWMTVSVGVGWLVGMSCGLALWRWATGPLAPHEVARLGMVRTFQLTKALSKLKVIENMRLGAQHQRGERFLPALLQLWVDQEARITERADLLLDRFLLASMRDEFAGTLSGGQRKLLEMARALMTEPAVVMLDEPMAGVNPALTQSLLEHVTNLRDDGMTVVFVEHDMDVVSEISDWVVVMAEGRIIAEGPPSVVGRDQRVIDAYLGAHHERSLEQLDSAQLEREAAGELAAEEVHGDGRR